jgi:hypothetical protein
VQFAATGKYSDGSTQDLTTLVTWASSDASASISNTQGSRGLATALSAGAPMITATLAGVTGGTTFTITNATLTSIALSPVNQSLPKGIQIRYKANGSYSDGSVVDITTAVTWSSSNSNVAVLYNSSGDEGLALGVSAGMVTVTATQGGVNGSTQLTVTSATLTSIQVTPANQTVAKGTLTQFTATGAFSSGPSINITQQVTWQSSNELVATVSNAQGSQGLVTAAGQGATSISALLFNVTGSTGLTVP